MAQLGYNNMTVHRHRNPALRGLHVNARRACRRSSFSTTAPCLNTVCLSTVASQLALVTPAHSYRPV
jgi:hypothetical protein